MWDITTKSAESFFFFWYSLKEFVESMCEHIDVIFGWMGTFECLYGAVHFKYLWVFIDGSYWAENSICKELSYKIGQDTKRKREKDIDFEPSIDLWFHLSDFFSNTYFGSICEMFRRDKIGFSAIWIQSVVQEGRVFDFSKDSFWTKDLPIIVEYGDMIVAISYFFERIFFEDIFEDLYGLSRLKIIQHISIEHKTKHSKNQNNNNREKKCDFILSSHLVCIDNISDSFYCSDSIFSNFFS